MTQLFLLKPCQNKKFRKIFQVHRFRGLFLRLADEKNTENGASGKIFGPSYFVTALGTKKDEHK